MKHSKDRLIVVLLAIFMVSGNRVAQKMVDYTGPVFPTDHALNMPIDDIPVHPNSKNYVLSIGENAVLHPDFGTAWNDGGKLRQIGIPYNIVGTGQPLVPIKFVSYPGESDPGPYPIPQNPYIETVFDWRDRDYGDRHMLIVDSVAHILYEAAYVYGNAGGTAWEAGCGAVFDLTSNKLRPQNWTSTDAAGLPIFPLLIRYDEVERALASGGEVRHPIRFTAVNTQRTYVWPARHFASSSTDPNRPPMGLRFRLKASVDISGYSPRMQVILRTMKKYGLIVADNGGNWFFQGTHDERWNDEEISTLKRLRGRDFEAVDISVWTNRPGFNPNSAAVPPDPGTGASGIQYDQNQDKRSLQNYPNPFHTSTTISFSLPAAEKISLKIFDYQGREVATLANEVRPQGAHTFIWDGRNTTRQAASNGVYFCQLRSGNGISLTRMMIFQ